MLSDDLFSEICRIPAIDVHSHLRRNQMAATGVGKLLFYHMLVYPLRAAGGFDDAHWPSKQLHGDSPDTELLYDAWMRSWPLLSNTGFAWILQTILRDLYEFDEPVTPESLPRLRAAFDRKANQPDWPRQVLTRGNIVAILSSYHDVPPLAPGEYDGGIRFTLETAPTVGTHEAFPWRQRLERLGRRAGIEIATLGQLARATQEFFDKTDWAGKNVLVNWIGSEADFRPVDASVIDRLLADCLRGMEPAPDGARLLEGAVVRCTLEAVRRRIKVYQLVYGTQFPTAENAPHPVQKAWHGFAASISHLAAEFPEIHFNILNGYEPDEPVLCSLCLAYANVSLGSFWWQTFYPSVMHAAWHRRLDMVPVSRLCGFFSDGYSVDYIYGRLRLSQRVLANVLAERIDRGFGTRQQALDIARHVMLETPRKLLMGK
ncbi:MAG TPA: hypothetical protein VM186_13640 [Planctomycetota bacterium]|nr:hypothetical protein [Planctomycetota bacterium]